MDWLLEVAHNIPLDYGFEDNPKPNINPDAWERYKRIVYGIMVTDYTDWGFIHIRYTKTPIYTKNNSLCATATLSQNSSFTDEAKTAFVMLQFFRMESLPK